VRDRSTLLLVLYWVLYGTATAAVGLRLVARRRPISSGYGLDDAFIVVALLILLPSIVLQSLRKSRMHSPSSFHVA
jgi:hypothetical protein